MSSALLGWKKLLPSADLAMCRETDIRVCDPSDMDEDVIIETADLIASGGQNVINSFVPVVQRAHLLALAFSEGRVVGCCALKRPDSDYRLAMFSKAGVAEMAASYLIERGYLMVAPEHRGVGLGQKLTRRLLSEMPSTPLFATVRARNTIAKKITLSQGFEQAGNRFVGFSGHDIDLLVRPG